MAEKKKKKRSLADDLQRYADRSLRGLGRMRDEIQDAIRSVPQPVDDVAGMVAPYLLGSATANSIALGGEAGRHWRDGDYGKSLVRFSDALVAPLDDAFFFIPGFGLVRKAL